MNMNLGPEINGHLIGLAMKEWVRRAIVEVRNSRQVFEVESKMGYSGSMDDLRTTVDLAAQRHYLRGLTECFPNAGVVAEENDLSIPCAHGCRAYFTVDPLDGTRAFVRRQSHGVGTMISLVQDGEVVAAYVGDTNTSEIYGYRPGSEKVHRITEFNNCESLLFTEEDARPLSDQYILLRDPERMYSPTSQELIRTGFRNQSVDGGSIGIWLARLWKREVGAALIPPSWETPWDSSPVIGISEKLGYCFLRPSESGGWERFTPDISREKYRREYDMLIVHQHELANLLS